MQIENLLLLCYDGDSAAVRFVCSTKTCSVQRMFDLINIYRKMINSRKGKKRITLWRTYIFGTHLAVKRLFDK